jgi:hypothetical protein
MLVSKKSLRLALLLICALKSLFFLTFIVDRNPNTPSALIVNKVALKGGDSQTYYSPLQKLYDEGVYSGICRMPGLSPVYLPLRLFLSHENAQAAIVFIQLLFDILASFLCAMLCLGLFQSKYAFWTSILFTSLSSFVLVRANYLLSDSLCCSAIILCCWFLYTWKNSKKPQHLIISGCFIVWAVFLRQISVTMIPCFIALILFYSESAWKRRLANCILFTLPLLIGLSSWTLRNKLTYGRTIVFVAPITECMGQLTPEYFAIKSMLLSMGQDVEYWSNGTPAHWFYYTNESYNCPVPARNLSPAIPLDSIITLRERYKKFMESNQTDKTLSDQIVYTCNRYSHIYREERPIRYYLLDPINHLLRFLLPKRLDDLPIPKFSEAAWHLKLLKGGNHLLLIIINTLSLLAFLTFAINRKIAPLLWLSVGLLPIAYLSYLGWVEQRYLATSHYLFILGIGGLAALIEQKFKRALPKQ